MCIYMYATEVLYFLLCLDSADVRYLLHQDVQDIQRQSALFILKMKEHRRLSQVSIDDIVHNSGGLFEMTIEHGAAGIRARLAEAGVELSSLNGLDTASLFEDVAYPFQGLETCYHQEKYFVEKLGLVVGS